MAVNINRDIDDPFYRYKMPRLVAKVEGSGNGIKTLIVNMEDIGKSLSRPPSYVTKYFGCELGAQTQMDEKSSRFIVNGAHDAARLSELLDGFIKKFVSCQKCRNPETNMRIKFNDDISLKCLACGAENLVDMRHRIIPYILKNPPPGARGDSSSSKKKPKEERRREKQERAARKAKAAEDGTEEEEVSPPVSKSSGKSSSKSTTPPVEKETPSPDPVDIKSAEVIPVIENDDDAFSVDTSEAAAAERRQQFLESSVLKKLVLAEEKELKDPYEELAEMLEDSAKKVEEIVSFVKSSALNEEKVAAVVIQVLFNADIVKQFPSKKKLLSKLITTEKAQKGVLGGIERLTGLAHPELQKKLNSIVKLFYDHDILDEGVIIIWAENPSKKYVDLEVARKLRKVLAPFIEWLQNAEEDDDDDEDDE